MKKDDATRLSRRVCWMRFLTGRTRASLKKCPARNGRSGPSVNTICLARSVAKRRKFISVRTLHSMSFEKKCRLPSRSLGLSCGPYTDLITRSARMLSACLLMSTVCSSSSLRHVNIYYANLRLYHSIFYVNLQIFVPLLLIGGRVPHYNTFIRPLIEFCDLNAARVSTAFQG